MPHHPLTMLWELVFTWFHLALTYKRVRLRITTVPLLLFDQGQNQDRLLRLRQGPKVSLFFCLVLFCFVFYRESLGLLPSYRWVRLSWKDFFLLLLLLLLFPLTFFPLFPPPPFQHHFPFDASFLSSVYWTYVEQSKKFYNGHNGYYSGQWRIMH